MTKSWSPTTVYTTPAIIKITTHLRGYRITYDRSSVVFYQLKTIVNISLPISIIAAALSKVANKSCSGSTIIVNRHYKHNAFGMPQHARCILTMENVAYSDFMKMTKNDNVLTMFTRDTIVHTPNSAISTCHSLVSMPSLFLNNMLQSRTKQ